MGKDPFPFDLLYWNSDSTRMPANMHSFYLRNMYMKNLLGEPGGITLAACRSTCRKVKVPAYFISTVEDHIAPWKTTYMGAQLPRRPVRFVLGGSGHIAGIVNPPAAKKYHYWTNDATARTRRRSGSRRRPSTRAPGGRTGRRWMDARNGGEQSAGAHAGDGARMPLEDAPGSYVDAAAGTPPSSAGRAIARGRTRRSSRRR